MNEDFGLIRHGEGSYSSDPFTGLSSRMVFLKILRLFENFLLDLIAIDGRIPILGEEDDEVDLEFGLDAFWRLSRK